MIGRRFMRALRARFIASDSGSATVEFTVLFPLLASIMLMGADSGWVMIQRVSLERALDLSVRDVRLGRLDADTTHAEFITQICDHANLLTHCNERLRLEMRRIDTQSWALPQEPVRCINLAEPISPPTIFSIPGNEAVMLLRACYLVRPIFPTTRWGLQLPLDEAGMFSLRSVSGFVTE